jgi:hypothetical protein
MNEALSALATAVAVLHFQATNKPPPSHQQATNKPPTSHQQATNKPPTSHQQATNKPPPSMSLWTQLQSTVIREPRWSN